jgi:membrane protein
MPEPKINHTAIHTAVLHAARTFCILLRNALREFQANDPLRMAAATAFFASFALPPIMIILIEVFGVFGNPRTVSHDLFEQLGKAMDKNTVLQIRLILRNVRLLSLSRGMQTGGFIFLLFVATTLFEVVKNSMNQLWKIRLKEKRGIVTIILYRVKSIGIIVMAGILFLLVLLGDAKGWLFQQFVYHGVAILAVAAWFTLVLKFLADGRPVWRIAIAGGLFTGLLFALGEVLLHWLLAFSKVRTIYGASTALVLLLLFVFYSAFIFYYGACFTRAFADHNKQPIRPTRYAVGYALHGVEL